MNFEDTIEAADRLYAKGKLREASVAYQEVLKYRTISVADVSKSFNSYDALIIERLADIQISLEETKAADLLLSSLEDILHANANTVVWTCIVLKRCELHLATDDIDEAFKTLKVIQQITGDVSLINFNQLNSWENQCPISKLAETDKNILFPRLVYVMGRILMGIGQYNNAISLLLYGDKKLSLSNNIATRSLLCSFPLAIAQANLEKGEMSIAFEWVKKANKAQLVAEDPSMQISFLELKAKLFLLQGKLGETLTCLKQICDWYSGKGLLHGTLISMLNLAQTRIYLNQISAAQKLLDEVIKLSIKTGNVEIIRQAKNLQNLANERVTSIIPTVSVIPTLISLRKYPAAKSQEQVLNRSANKNIWYEGDQQAGYLSRFEIRALIYQCMLATGQFEKAKIELEALNLVFKKTDSLLISFRIIVLQYMQNYFENNAVDVTSLEKCCNYFHEQQLLPELWQAQRLLSQAQIAEPLARQKLLEKNQSLLNTLSQSLPDEQQSVFLLNKWTAEEEYINQKVLELSPLNNIKKNWVPKIFRVIRMFFSIALLMNLIDIHKKKIVMDTIGKKNPPTSLKNYLSLFKILLFHSSDKLTLSFLVLPDRTLLLHYRKFHIGFKIISLSRLQLRSLIEDWHKTSAEDVRSIDISSPERKEKLGKISEIIAHEVGLLDILDNMPAHFNRLTIVPDDALWGFPFSSIIYKNNYLIERMAISIKFLSMPVSEKTIGSSKVKSGLCAYVANGGNNFAVLPGAAKEATLIAEILKSAHHFENVELLPDSLATSAKICEKARQSRVMHVACHGKFDRNDPGNSGLVLSGEKLTIREIAYSQNFSTVEHITLSACWSADLFILPGRWIISLPQAFAYSGVKSILSSYWQVNDDVALSFMKSFYLYAAEFPRDVALQKCQIDSIHNNLPDCLDDTSNPFFWSGFSIYGENSSRDI